MNNPSKLEEKYLRDCKLNGIYIPEPVLLEENRALRMQAIGILATRSVDRDRVVNKCIKRHKQRIEDGYENGYSLAWGGMARFVSEYQTHGFYHSE